MVPAHLSDVLTRRDRKLIRELPWIYTTPIFIR